MSSLGIIAGAGRFPFLVAQGARLSQKRLVIVGLRGLADPKLSDLADSFHWAGVARLGRWIRLLKRGGVERVILAGSVKKSDMFGRYRLLTYLPDWTSIRLWFFRLADKRNDTVLRGIADEMAGHGIIMDECVRFCPEAMAPEGVLTSRQPSTAQFRDIDFGWAIAKEMGRLDIGQSVAVKEMEILAVEAIEGTDRMIHRSGELCPRGGWMLIKVAKPNQDMRFDVPTVGPETIENIHRHGGAGLVIEAKKTLMIDREILLAAADRYGMVVVGRTMTA